MTLKGSLPAPSPQDKGCALTNLLPFLFLRPTISDVFGLIFDVN